MRGPIHFISESFINGVGITRPSERRQRFAALFIVALLAATVVVVALFFFFLLGRVH